MSQPVVTFEQVSKEKYQDTVVYKFHLLVDGVKVLQPEPSNEGIPEDQIPEPSNLPEEFTLQVHNACCPKQALKEFIDNYTANLVADNTSIPDLELPSE